MEYRHKENTLDYAENEIEKSLTVIVKKNNIISKQTKFK